MTSLRHKRLEMEARLLHEAFNGHPLILVVPTGGSPPERYAVEYLVRGLELRPDGTIQSRTQHEVEITVPVEYPHRPPMCRMKTPAFHPNIDAFSICTADHWAAQETMVGMVLRIGRMLTWQLYNTKSPLNADAAVWCEQNAHRLPVDPTDIAPLPAPSPAVLVRLNMEQEVAQRPQPPVPPVPPPMPRVSPAQPPQGLVHPTPPTPPMPEAGVSDVVARTAPVSPGPSSMDQRPRQPTALAFIHGHSQLLATATPGTREHAQLSQVVRAAGSFLALEQALSRSPHELAAIHDQLPEPCDAILTTACIEQLERDFGADLTALTHASPDIVRQFIDPLIERSSPEAVAVLQRAVSLHALLRHVDGWPLNPRRHERVSLTTDGASRTLCVGDGMDIGGSPLFLGHDGAQGHALLLSLVDGGIVARIEGTDAVDMLFAGHRLRLRRMPPFVAAAASAPASGCPPAPVAWPASWSGTTCNRIMEIARAADTTNMRQGLLRALDTLTTAANLQLGLLGWRRLQLQTGATSQQWALRDWILARAREVEQGRDRWLRDGMDPQDIAFLDLVLLSSRVTLGP